MAAPEGFLLTRLLKRRATELSGPDDERVVEQTARLQVHDEGRDAAIGARRVRAVVVDEHGAVAVGIPSPPVGAVVVIQKGTVPFSSPKIETRQSDPDAVYFAR